MASRTTTDHRWIDDAGSQWSVTLTWQDYECVGVAIEAPPGSGSRITAALVRKAPVGKFIKEARQSAATKADAEHDGTALPNVGAEHDRKKPDGHYHEVANVYFWAWVRGRAPLEAIRGHFQVSHSTAARWVREARARKILGRAEHGRAGGYPRWIDPEEEVMSPGYRWSYTVEPKEGT